MYKFINENEIEKAPLYIIEGDFVISNPLAEKLAELGFKELVVEPYPETSEGCYRTPIYIDGDETITQSWSEEKAGDEHK